MFPSTRVSILASVRSADAEQRALGLEALTRAYWRPVYKYLRLRWRASPEDAEDLTQEFFARALAGETFARYDAREARFRTFLRLCLDGFVVNQRKAAGRLKRGGEYRFVSLDFAGAEGEVRQQELPNAMDSEHLFRREWVRGLFGSAVETLRAQCAALGKEVHFSLFERYDLDGVAPSRPTYAQLAEEFDIPVTQVTNYLSFARREFRRIVLESLREICGSDEEFRAEARELLGADPS